jgi:hypothetical protein
MLKQTIVANTIEGEMLVELSEGEQEASNGGIYMVPSDNSPTITMPAFPVISIGMYDSPNVSCPACSSGLNPHGGVTTPAEGTLHNA